MSIIATDGVINIDVYVPTDALALSKVDADPEHRLRFGFPDDFIPSVVHAEQVIATWNKDRLRGKQFAFAIRFIGSDELIAGCELQPKENARANVSYWTHPNFRRQGIAKRAVALLPSVATQYGLRVLEILCDSDNTVSRRVAITCGYTEQGTRDGQILYLLKLH
ncbi:MAG: GNAT family N-acetyltransferase [Planctomycetes bacterium]|nr:GNAT family N-acetyltransferase [Planctomycetota bacterium]